MRLARRRWFCKVVRQQDVNHYELILICEACQNHHRMTTELAGKLFAEMILTDCVAQLVPLQAAGFQAGLAIVLVGDDSASLTYIRRKRAMCKRLGIASTFEHLPATATLSEVIATVARLNAEPSIHGIIVQQPLPAGIKPLTVVEAVLPCKDVDGLHPHNFGLLVSGQREQLVACTPLGCMFLLNEIGVEPRGKRATVVGRSMIVGRPLAQLLDQAGATVTVCHSATPDLAEACRTADILAVAVGQPGLVTAAMVKPGATVLDIGISRNTAGQLCGDVDEGVYKVAAYYTPVPGGIGPLTVAMLMKNTVTAAKRAQELQV